MKKHLKAIGLVTFCFMLMGLWSCDKDDNKGDVDVAEEVPVIDAEALHNLKLTSVLNTVPYTVRTSKEMYDSNYGEYTVQVFDSKSAMVWALTWRDLSLKLGPFNPMRKIEGDKMFVSIQGTISVHDLLTGEFLWEVETESDHSNFSVYGDVLYVLHCKDQLVSTFDVETGGHLEDWQGDYQGLTGIYVNDENITLYYSTEDSYERNAYLLNKDWVYDKRVKYDLAPKRQVRWDQAESSDEDQASSQIGLIIDGSLDSKWSEGVKGYGEKEWFELKKNLPTMVYELVIYNGDHTSDKAYEENAKIKQASISVGNNKSFLHIFDTFVYNEPAVIEFIRPITADYLYLQIVEAQPGTLYKNTVITEVYTQ